MNDQVDCDKRVCRVFGSLGIKAVKRSRSRRRIMLIVKAGERSKSQRPQAFRRCVRVLTKDLSRYCTEFLHHNVKAMRAYGMPYDPLFIDHHCLTLPVDQTHWENRLTRSTIGDFWQAIICHRQEKFPWTPVSTVHKIYQRVASTDSLMGHLVKKAPENATYGMVKLGTMNIEMAIINVRVRLKISHRARSKIDFMWLFEKGGSCQVLLRYMISMKCVPVSLIPWGAHVKVRGVVLSSIHRWVTSKRVLCMESKKNSQTSYHRYAYEYLQQLAYPCRDLHMSRATVEG